MPIDCVIAIDYCNRLAPIIRRASVVANIQHLDGLFADKLFADQSTDIDSAKQLYSKRSDPI